MILLNCLYIINLSITEEGILEIKINQQFLPNQTSTTCTWSFKKLCTIRMLDLVIKVTVLLNRLQSFIVN